MSEPENILRQALREIQAETHFGNEWNLDRLKMAVIDIILEETETYSTADTRSYLNDVLNYGCEYGTVSSLCNYSDTHEFFEAHYTAIEYLREKIRTDLGVALNIQGDLINGMAWEAFEYMARFVYDRLTQ